MPATPSTAQPVTVTFAEVEIRNYRQGNAEVVLTYPHPNIRLVTTRTTAGVLAFSIETLFTDQLGSIRDVVKGAVRSSVSTYEPFGKPIDVVQPSIIAEAHGFIGERFDPATQLQYLNARYYDPELALFLQPDWLDPVLPGVGTHRYAYAGQDPVNARDPGGHDSFGPGNPYDGYNYDGHGTCVGGYEYDYDSGVTVHVNDNDSMGSGGGGGDSGFSGMNGGGDCPQCYNDISLFPIRASIVDATTGQTLILIYARTEAGLAALRRDAIAYVVSGPGGAALQRLRENGTVVYGFEMFPPPEEAEERFSTGMSSESSPEFFVNPARLGGRYSYTDINGNAVAFPLGFVFGHEATHIIYDYRGSEETSVLDQFDNRFTDELGLPRRCPIYFGTCP